MRSAVASTTITRFNRVRYTVIAIMRFERAKSCVATPVPIIQFQDPKPRRVKTIIRTLATFPGQVDGETVRVGDEREYYIGYPLRTLRSAQAYGDSDCHERRWQYALRVSTSASGARRALP